MKITIFGLAGSGTSTLGKLLSGKLDHTFMSTGNIMRAWATEKGYTIYEFEDKIIKQDKSFDQKLDNKVKDFGINNKDFIFESRLAWSFIPDSFKIFLHCDDSVRYNRIQSREGGFLEDIIDKTKKRESELISRYKDVYPEINFPPKKEDFDLFIDGTNLSIEETLDEVLKNLK